MTRRAVLLAACCLAGALGAAPAHADTTARCFSPTLLTPTDCSSWHNQPVILQWDSTGAKIPGECLDVPPFKTEGETTFSCAVLNSGLKDVTFVTLRIDVTPPAIAAPTPSRPPDVNGWWNHPVGFTFTGTDRLSKVASCDTVTYSGPDGRGAVTGGCHDVAGNYGVASYPLTYDSTPPAINRVKAMPESRSAVISWDATDAVRALVTRTAPGRASASAVVYSGRGNHFTDSGIQNGRTYTYNVRVYDQADNSSSRTVHAKPAVSLGLKPRRNARLTRPPRLRWPAVRHADYYNVQLYRGGQKLLTAWPAAARLRLRRVLHLHGVTIRLRSGHYRWYVWPGYGSRAAHRYGSFIGQSSFVLKR